MVIIHHWINAHLFQAWSRNLTYLTAGQVGLVLRILLECQEENCQQKGAFLLETQFDKHIRHHKQGVPPGRLCKDIESRADGERRFKRSLSVEEGSFLGWTDKFITDLLTHPSRGFMTPLAYL
jgi:hypothetical protein